MLAGLLVGVGVMAAVDEILFHQLLGWHHFYDRATPAVGLLSDGLLHAAELLAVVGGSFIAADLLGSGRFAKHHFWSSLFIGLGGFQLFDGAVNHKVLRLHQVRYDVYLPPYDVAWNLAGALLLLIGLLLWRAPTRRRERMQAALPPGAPSGDEPP